MSGSTLTAKLIESHLVRCDDELLVLRVDQVLIEDATGLMAALQFEPLGVSRSQVPLAVCYMDHNVLQIDEKNKQDHLYLQAFCRRYGVHYSKPGNGISHCVHLERFGRPGELLIGADSHSSMAGALGMLAVGVSGLEVAVAMARAPLRADPAGNRGRGAPRPAAKRRAGQRHRARDADLRVPRRGRPDVVGQRACNDLQHGGRDRRYHRRVPVR